MTDLTREIAAVASVMDQIDNCRQPIPCDLCRERMQSILDIGAAAERERIRQLAAERKATYDETKPCGCGRTLPDGSACVVHIRSGVPFAGLLADDTTGGS